jgi:hypothetical protein
MAHKIAIPLLLCLNSGASFLLFAQQQAVVTHPQSAGIDQVLARLDRLELENQKLLEEVRELRKELQKDLLKEQPQGAPAESPVTDRVEVLERRSEEVDQSKVAASQRFPIAITGMALFNVWSNGRNNGGLQDPVVAAPAAFSNSGATFRQTVIGLRYNGPQTFAGGKVTGALDLDLWGGDSTSLNHLIRLRTATIRVDWRNTSVSVGQDKPLISPRDPDSLAQVAFSPFTAAGNPWQWQPQVRVEQRFSFDENAGVRLQGSIYETREQNTNLPAALQAATPANRPGYEGRTEFWLKWGQRRLHVAPGFHASTTHIQGVSLESRAYSVDWLFTPLEHWEITGAFYAGQNLNTIAGGLPSVSLLPGNRLVPVHVTQGWAQSSWQVLPRLKLNAFMGEQSNRGSDLVSGALRSNVAWGGNLMYRLAPNVITSLEALQLRSNFLNSGIRLNNHYDLALAYLF